MRNGRSEVSNSKNSEPGVTGNGGENGITTYSSPSHGAPVGCVVAATENGAGPKTVARLAGAFAARKPPIAEGTRGVNAARTVSVRCNAG